MKRHILLILLACNAFSCMSAPKDYLLIWDKNQIKSTFALSDCPRISFTETDLIISCNGLTINYDMASVSRYSYEQGDYSTGIRDLVSNNEVKITDDAILISNLPQGSSVCIYSVNGSKVFTTKADKNGQCTCSITDLIPGVYIIKAYRTTFRLMKK